MRIVARRASDAAVVGIVALAVGQAIGLEADVLNAARTVDRDLRPGAMALAAEVGQVLGGELARASSSDCRRGGHRTGRGSVRTARLPACHPGERAGLREIGGVAVEAEAHFRYGRDAAGRFREIAGRGGGADGEVETAQCGVVADAAFVPAAVAAEEVRLSDGTLRRRPMRRALAGSACRRVTE